MLDAMRAQFRPHLCLHVVLVGLPEVNTVRDSLRQACFTGQSALTARLEASSRVSLAEGGAEVDFSFQVVHDQQRLAAAIEAALSRVPEWNQAAEPDSEVRLGAPLSLLAPISSLQRVLR